MRKKILMILLSLIFLLSFPVSVYAFDCPPFKEIAVSQGIDTRVETVVVEKDSYYYIFFGSVNFSVTYQDSTLKTNQNWNKTDTYASVYKVSTSNPYDTWVSVSTKSDDPYTNFTTNGRTIVNCSMVYNTVDIPVSPGYEPSGGTDPVSPDYSSDIADLNKKYYELSQKIVELENELPELVKKAMEEFQENLATVLEELHNDNVVINKNISSIFSSIKDNIVPSLKSLDTRLKSIQEKLSLLLTKADSINNNITSFREQFNSYTVKALQFFSDMSQLVSDIKTLLEEQNPLSESNKDNYNDAVNTFIGNLDSFNSFFDYTDNLLNLLQTGEQHSITIHTFGTSWNVGSKNISIPSYPINIDFSWYEPIQTQAKNIMRAFMWITWVWYFLKRLPNLLNGLGIESYTTPVVEDNTPLLNGNTAPTETHFRFRDSAGVRKDI